MLHFIGESSLKVNDFIRSSVVWGEKLLVSLVRGTGRTTRTSHTTRGYIGRLVNTLDNLYQAVVLDMLGGLNRFLQYKITNCSNNRTISQNTFTVFARHLYSTLCSWIITFTCTRNFLAKISNVWGKKMVVSLVRGTGCTTREYITRLVNILDDSRESYDSWIH